VEKNGIMEGGVLEYWVEKEMVFPLFHHSYIPPFQVEIIPFF
jgi:hypothetical protein